MATKNLKEQYKMTIKDMLQQKFKYNNVMSIPKLEKIVINRGLGEVLTNSKVVELTYNQMAVLSGQKPVLTKAKKAISNFKIRKDQVIGCKVTLRSQKMYDFLTKFMFIVLPKIRDFRGVPKNSFDGRGNYTLSLKEDSVFPEIEIEADRLRGFDITFVTSAESDEEAKVLLEAFGMPFRN